MRLFRSACSVHRPVLVDLLDRGERGPGTPAALDHLRRCAACERDLTGIALTLAALRRAGATYRSLPDPVMAAGPAPGRAVPAHPRAHARSSWRLQAGGLLSGAAIAALLVVPRAGMVAVVPVPDQGASTRHVEIVSWHAVEARLATSPDTASPDASGSLPPRYPDGLLRPWKEVPGTDATARVLEPF
ncbi:MAG: hypothetical protein WCK58_15210 [Chloroflexota bacterium]